MDVGGRRNRKPLNLRFLPDFTFLHEWGFELKALTRGGVSQRRVELAESWFRVFWQFSIVGERRLILFLVFHWAWIRQKCPILSVFCVTIASRRPKWDTMTKISLLGTSSFRVILSQLTNRSSEADPFMCSEFCICVCVQLTDRSVSSGSWPWRPIYPGSTVFPLSTSPPCWCYKNARIQWAISERKLFSCHACRPKGCPELPYGQDGYVAISCHNRWACVHHSGTFHTGKQGAFKVWQVKIVQKEHASSRSQSVGIYVLQIGFFRLEILVWKPMCPYFCKLNHAYGLFLSDRKNGSARSPSWTWAMKTCKLPRNNGQKR